MVILNTISDLTFTGEDLIIIMSTLIPAIIAFVGIKWRVNILENRITEIERDQKEFKKIIYQKLDENKDLLHKTLLQISGVKNDIYTTVLDAVGKLQSKK